MLFSASFCSGTFMEMFLSTSQETEIIIYSCKNNCLLISHFLLFSGCLSKSFSSCPDTKKHPGCCLFDVRFLPVIILSICLLVPTPDWCPRKLRKIQNVCECVSECVSRTANQAVLYFIERTFPAVSAESRLGARIHIYEASEALLFFRKLLM